MLPGLHGLGLVEDNESGRGGGGRLGVGLVTLAPCLSEGVKDGNCWPGSAAEVYSTVRLRVKLVHRQALSAERCYNKMHRKVLSTEKCIHRKHRECRAPALAPSHRKVPFCFFRGAVRFFDGRL